MNNKRLLALFGLKWNPFIPNIPVQSLWPAPGIKTFLFQIENLVMDGGFALMGGEPGLGKIKESSISCPQPGTAGKPCCRVMETPAIESC